MDPQVNQSSQTDSSGVSFGSPEVVVPLSSPSTPAVPIPPELPKQSLFLVKLAQVLLGVAILAAVAYFVGTFVTGKKVTPTPTFSPAAVSSPTPTPDPTANWKTYTMKGFQFKYPDNLFAVDDSSLELPNSVVIYKEEQDLENCHKRKLYEAGKFTCFPSISLSYSIVTGAPSEGFVDGIEYVRYINPQGVEMIKNKTQLGGMVGSADVLAYVVNSFQIYKVDIGTFTANCYPTPCPNISDKEFVNRQNELLNQILSTFKFLVASPTPSATPQ